MSKTISRRELLKRGAKYGGAVVFVTPVVNVIGMEQAGASTGGSNYGISDSDGDDSKGEDKERHGSRRRRRDW